MMVDAANKIAPLRATTTAQAPQDTTSSSLAEGTGDSTSPAPSPPNPESQNRTDPSQYVIAGNLSLGLHFALAQSQSTFSTTQTANGYSEFRQTISQNFSADYQFDLSFMDTLDSTAQKLGSIGQDALNQFVDAANGLTSLNEGDLQKFNSSVDNLFNTLTNATGGNNAIAGVKDLLKGSVTDFIHSVRNEMDKLSASVGSGVDPGKTPQGPLSPPNGQTQGGQTPPNRQPMPGIDFNKLMDQTIQRFDGAYGDLLQGMVPDTSKLINANLNSFMDQLKGIMERTDPLPSPQASTAERTPGGTGAARRSL